MKIMQHELTVAIKSSFPDFFYPHQSFYCQDGWATLIECGCLILSAINKNKTIKFGRIGERFGRLDLNVEPQIRNDRIWETPHVISSMIEKMSSYYCEECGSPGDMYIGILMPSYPTTKIVRCQKCIDKINNKPNSDFKPNFKICHEPTKYDLSSRDRLKLFDQDAGDLIRLSVNYDNLDKDCDIDFPAALYSIVRCAVLEAEFNRLLVRDISWDNDVGLSIQLSAIELDSDPDNLMKCNIISRLARLVSSWVDLNTGQLMLSV